MKALITGASGGLGKQFALSLANKYDQIVIVSRNTPKLMTVKSEIEKINPNCVVTIETWDLSEYKNCIELFSRHPQVDLLVNNAGKGDTGLFEETSLDNDIELINLNVTAVHVLTKLYLKQMKNRDKGQIINVASIAGFMASPRMASYYASKNYVVRISEAIREELNQQKSNVRISVLCPGQIETDFKNNANVDYRFKGSDPKVIVDYCLNNLDKFYIIPEASMRASRILNKILPTSLMSKIMFMAKKKI